MTHRSPSEHFFKNLVVKNWTSFLSALDQWVEIQSGKLEYVQVKYVHQVKIKWGPLYLLRVW